MRSITRNDKLSLNLTDFATEPHMTHETIATLRAAINQAYLADENEIVGGLLAGLGTYDPVTVSDCAKTLVNAVRAKKRSTIPYRSISARISAQFTGRHRANGYCRSLAAYS